MPAERSPDRPADVAVTLVPVRPADASDVAAGRLPDHGPALRPGRGWPSEGTAIGLGYTAHGGSSWLAVVDGAVVGDLGTKGPPDAAGAVEIGYGLSAAYRGRGLGTRAVARLLDELWARPAVRTVTARVALDNTASHRLLHRLGFTAGEVADGECSYRLERSPR